MEIKEITYEELQNMPDALILDVREPYEFNERNIGGIHIPLGNLAEAHAQLSKNEEFVVVCAHGIRSMHACHFLQTRGYKVYNLTGGIAAILE